MIYLFRNTLSIGIDVCLDKSAVQSQYRLPYKHARDLCQTAQDDFFKMDRIRSSVCIVYVYIVN